MLLDLAEMFRGRSILKKPGGGTEAPEADLLPGPEYWGSALTADDVGAAVPQEATERDGDAPPLAAVILDPLACGDIFGAACGVIGLRDAPDGEQRAAVAAAWSRLTPEGQGWLLAAVAAAERWYVAGGTPAPAGAGWPPEGAGDGTLDPGHAAALVVEAGLSWAERAVAGLARVMEALRWLSPEEWATALPHLLVAARIPQWSDEDWAEAQRLVRDIDPAHVPSPFSGRMVPSPPGRGRGLKPLTDEQASEVQRVAVALWEGGPEDVPMRWVNYQGGAGGSGGDGGALNASSASTTAPVRHDGVPSGPSATEGRNGSQRAAVGAVRGSTVPPVGGGAAQELGGPLLRRQGAGGAVGSAASGAAASDSAAGATASGAPGSPRVEVALTPPRPTIVTDAAEFARVLAATEAVPTIGMDTETTGLDPHTDRIRTVQLATAEAAWVVDTWAVGALGPLRVWLAARARAAVRTVLHNAKFDLQMLRAALGGAPLDPVSVSDTMLWSQLLACGLPVDGGHGLAAVARRWLGQTLPKEAQRGDWTGVLRPEQVEYAGRDAWIIVPLADAMWNGSHGRKGIAAEGLERVAALEDACVIPVSDMEYDGIGFDLPYWNALTEEIRAAAAAARAEALRLFAPVVGRPSMDQAPKRQRNLFGEEVAAAAQDALNLNSPPQVLAALRSMGLDVTSTAEDALKPLAQDNAAIKALLEYKRQTKLLSAFGEKLPQHVHRVTGRIHADYHQLCANGVGRFSCSSPNVQQIPHDARFRRAFAAPEGRRLVIADLSQIELRIMAKLSGDRRMLEAYQNGEDLHRLTASLVAGVPLAEVTKAQRQMAKAVNFGLCYGMSANGLRAYAANSYGASMTEAEAETFRRRYFEAYCGVTAFHHRQDTEARRARETRTLLGRCRRWADTNMGLPELANSPDQGTGADILKAAMVAVRPVLLRAGASMVASVHDELVVEAPEDRAEEVRDAVRGALVAAGAALLNPVPVDAEAAVGRTWADKA